MTVKQMRQKDAAMPRLTWQSIPLDFSVIERAKALIPIVRHADTWVAGSAATRWGHNKDVDIWVCNVSRDVNPLTLIPGSRVPEGGTDIAEEYDHICFKAIDDNGLQVMVTHDSIHEILEHFDISCHAGAVNITTGEILKAAGYSNKLVVINYQIAITTISRYLRFAERYQDWWGLSDDKTLECAAKAFNLKTNEDMHREIQWLRVDKGL